MDIKRNEFEEIIAIPTKRTDYTDPQNLGSNVATKKEIMKSNQFNLTQQDTSFSCDQCDKQYRNFSHLNRHKQSIHDAIKYPCDQCNYKATQSTNLQQHILSVHEGIKYPCEQCISIFSYPHKLRNHVKSVHNTEKFE